MINWRLANALLIVAGLLAVIPLVWHAIVKPLVEFWSN